MYMSTGDNHLPNDYQELVQAAMAGLTGPPPIAMYSMFWLVSEAMISKDHQYVVDRKLTYSTDHS